jgi:hypothetical protein
MKDFLVCFLILSAVVLGLAFVVHIDAQPAEAAEETEATQDQSIDDLPMPESISTTTYMPISATTEVTCGPNGCSVTKSRILGSRTEKSVDSSRTTKRYFQRRQPLKTVIQSCVRGRCR